MRTNVLTITGAPGSGKTRALRALIENATTAGGRVIAIDFHGDLHAAYGDRVVDLSMGRDASVSAARAWANGERRLLVITGAPGRLGELVAAVVAATEVLAGDFPLMLVADDVPLFDRDVRGALLVAAETLPPGSSVALAGSEDGGWAGQ